MGAPTNATELPNCTGRFAGSESWAAGPGLASVQELLGLLELAGLLERPPEERERLLAFLVAPRLLADAPYAFFDAVGIEGHVREGDDDLTDLAVNEVGLPSVHPGVAAPDPRPALHPDRVLDVLVF